MKGYLGKFKVFLLMMPFIFFGANRSSADRWSGTGESVTANSIRVKGQEGSAVTEDELRSLGKIETPFKACKDVTFIDGDTYNKNEARWRAIKASGFDSPTEVVLSTFVFKKWSGDKKISQRPGSLSGADFLLKVGDRAVADLKSGLDRYRALKTCVDSRSKAPACEELRVLFTKPIKETLPVFRQTLGQMKFVDPEVTPKIVMQRDWKAYVNGLGRAGAAGVFGPKANVLLSGTDLEIAQKAVRKEFEAAIESYKSRTEQKVAEKQLKGADADAERARAFDAKGIAAAGAYVHGKMAEFRAKKAIEYYQILNATPQLAYISGEDPTDEAAIGKIIDRMLTDGEAQLVETENQLRTARASQKTKADGELSRDLLHFASYSAVIDRVLRDETKDAAANVKSGVARYPVNCTIATALFNELKDAKTGDGLMLMSALITAPIGIGLGGVRATTLLTGGRLALSAEAAGHLAVAAGISGGLASTAVDVQNGLSAEREVRNELRTVDEAKDDINSANLAGPTGLLNFGGGKAAIGAVAGAAGKKLALGAGRREAVKAGASAAETKQAASLYKQAETLGGIPVSAVNFFRRTRAESMNDLKKSVQVAGQNEGLSQADLAKTLYGIHRDPVILSKEASTAAAGGKSYAEFILREKGSPSGRFEVTAYGEKFSANFSSGTEKGFMQVRFGGNPEEGGNPARVYISLSPDQLKSEMSSIVSAARESKASVAKFFTGDVESVTRPDRFVVGFQKAEDAAKFAARLSEDFAQKGLSGERVPFTLRVGSSEQSPVHIGQDMNKGMEFDSWRVKVTKSIAKAISDCPGKDIACIQGSLKRSGVDSDYWLPIRARDTILNSLGVRN